jgi:hypothetical protein
MERIVMMPISPVPNAPNHRYPHHLDSSEKALAELIGQAAITHVHSRNHPTGQSNAALKARIDKMLKAVDPAVRQQIIQHAKAQLELTSNRGVLGGLRSRDRHAAFQILGHLYPVTAVTTQSPQSLRARGHLLPADPNRRIEIQRFAS